MKKIKKYVVVALIIGSFGTSVVALAATQYVDGGTWNYGVGWSRNFGYSDYYHGRNNHSATTIWGSEVSKGTADPGRWALSRINKFPPTRMNYYYNVW